VKQIPTDWFLIPPSHEKDQGAAKDALRELASFLKTYPKSTHLAKANELYRQTVRRLADHEMYVARFYLDEGRPKGAILRLEALLVKYPEAGVDPEVMMLLGKTYLKLEQKDKAQATFAELVRRYPTDAYSAKARLYLEFLASAKAK
jgi:outer membrane protein assembly factor BamD